MPLPGILYPSSGLLPGGVSPGLFTQQLLDAHEPWVAEDTSGDLFNYLLALGSMFDLIASIVMDQGYPDDDDYIPGWSTLLDPDTCPTAFLPFLAQFNGTDVPPGTDDATARAIIKGETGFARGTLQAVEGAIRLWLSGSQTFEMFERQKPDGSADAYWFTVVVDPAVVIDATQLVAAVNAVKPAGIMWALVQQTGYTWNQATGTWNTDTMTWDQAASIQP